MEIFDITQELLHGNVFEGDTSPELIGRKSVEKDGFALSDLLLCLHNATHVDAPSHTLSEGAGVADAALSVFFGECVVCRAESAEKEFCGRMLFKGAPPDAALAQRLADRGILQARKARRLTRAIRRRGARNFCAGGRFFAGKSRARKGRRGKICPVRFSSEGGRSGGVSRPRRSDKRSVRHWFMNYLHVAEKLI